MTGLGLILLGLGVGCGGGDSPEDALVGDWILANAADTAGAGLTFKSDGSYVASTLAVKSSTSYLAEVEKGTFSVSGKTIFFSPTEYSCPEADPPYSFEYTAKGDTLTLTDPSDIFAFSRNTAPASAGAVITIGCFQPGGSFVASPLAPVQR